MEHPLKSLILSLCVALLWSSTSYAEKTEPPVKTKPTAQQRAAYKAAMNAKLEEIAARLKQHRQVLAHREQEPKQMRTDATP